MQDRVKVWLQGQCHGENQIRPAALGSCESGRALRVGQVGGGEDVRLGVTDEEILLLALEAVESPAARVVLEDALTERGDSATRHVDRFEAVTGSAGLTGAVAAVMLFGDSKASFEDESSRRRVIVP